MFGAWGGSALLPGSCVREVCGQAFFGCNPILVARVHSTLHVLLRKVEVDVGEGLVAQVLF